MKSRDFCFWLQGYFELRENENGLNMDQIKIIKNHLNMVFEHEINPLMFNPSGNLSFLYNENKPEKPRR